MLAGLVKNAINWQYSSYVDYAGLRKGNLCNKMLAAKYWGYEEKDFMLAKILLNELLYYTPSNIKLLILLGEINILLNDYENAIDIFFEIIDKDINLVDQKILINSTRMLVLISVMPPDFRYAPDFSYAEMRPGL